jgi:hypothetical protein
MTDRLVELEEQGWQAWSSPDPVAFCEAWLADDAVLVVPGCSSTFLAAADEQLVRDPSHHATADYSADRRGGSIDRPSDRTAWWSTTLHRTHDKRVRHPRRALAARRAPADTAARSVKHQESRVQDPRFDRSGRQRQFASG